MLLRDDLSTMPAAAGGGGGEPDMKLPLWQVMERFGIETPSRSTSMLQLMHFYGCFSSGALPASFLPVSECDRLLADIHIKSDEFVKMVADKFIRPKGLERAMLGEDSRLTDSALRDEIFGFFRDLGCIDKIEAQSVPIETIVVLGAAEPTVKIRIKAMEDLAKAHPEAKIYVLGSKRELWPFDEPSMSAIISSRAGVEEKEVIQFLRNSVLRFAALDSSIMDLARKQHYESIAARDMPEALLSSQLDQESYISAVVGLSAKSREECSELLSDISYRVISKNPTKLKDLRASIYSDLRGAGYNVPVEADLLALSCLESEVSSRGVEVLCADNRPDGTRASTADTIECLRRAIAAEVVPESLRNVALISNQPHAQYQMAVARPILAEGFNICLVAPAASVDINPLVVLDAIGLSIKNTGAFRGV